MGSSNRKPSIVAPPPTFAGGSHAAPKRKRRRISIEGLYAAANPHPHADRSADPWTMTSEANWKLMETLQTLGLNPWRS